MEVLYDIEDRLCDELEEINKKQDLGPSEVEMMYKVVDIIKDIETIHAMKDSSYSYASSYDDGMSYRRDSRGRYSRDSYAMRGNSSRYSRADEKEHMLAQIDEMKRKLEQM